LENAVSQRDNFGNFSQSPKHVAKLPKGVYKKQEAILNIQQTVPYTQGTIETLKSPLTNFAILNQMPKTASKPSKPPLNNKCKSPKILHQTKSSRKMNDPVNLYRNLQMDREKLKSISKLRSSNSVSKSALKTNILRSPLENRITNRSRSRPRAA
jgi:hypothetical protein